VEQQKLTASDGAGADYFSSSVSISDDTVVVGAFTDNDGGINNGSAYVYERSGGVWAEEQKLTASDSGSIGYMGSSVSISGDTVVVGAVYDDDMGENSGAVYTYANCIEHSLAPEADYTSPSIGYGMNYIPPGTFEMGCTPGQSDCNENESPVHEVTLTNGFYIGVTEITREQWESVMGSWSFASPSGGVDSGYANYPANEMSWEEVVAYANLLSDAEGLTRVYDNSSGDYTQDLSADGYRMPTEAEWEFAARCGEDTLYVGSDNIDDVGWSDENSDGSTHEVAERFPNTCGLYDMTGNVEEWTWDWFDAYYYDGGDMIDPVGPDMGTLRVLRGGAWSTGSENARVSKRRFHAPSDNHHGIGLRLARTVHADEDGVAAATAALSCLDILEGGYSTGNGTYWIDPDSTGAFEVYCDMTTDGGGWTLVFTSGGINYNTAELGYTVESPALMNVDSKMLAVHRDGDLDTLESWVAFHMPVEWSTTPPFQDYNGETEMDGVVLDGVSQGTVRLYHGYSDWTGSCGTSGWDNSDTRGQFCFGDITAPAYYNFARDQEDGCSAGLGTDEYTPVCTDDRLFTLAVRRTGAL
jgi:formylglycine-generating enzyme required for sulfatase activity